MKPVFAPRCAILSVLALFLLAGVAATQPNGLPTRSFERFGASKLRHGSRILCLAYAPDGEALAAGGGNDPVRVWDPKTGELLREINEPWVHAMTFSATSTTLLFGGSQKVVKMWNFKLNKETGRLEGHKATVKSVAISVEAGLIASGSQEGALYLWDMNNRRKVAELPGHTDEVNALTFFMEDNKTFLVSGSNDRTIIVWNLQTNQPKLKLDAGCGVYAMALSRDHKTLYTAGDDFLIRRWDLASGKQTGTFEGHTNIVVSLFVRGDTLISGALDKSVRFWDAKTTKQKRELARKQGECDALAVSAKGDFLAMAGINPAIRIVATDTLKDVSPAGEISASLIGLARSPDGKRLAAATADGQILVWNAKAGKLLKQWDSQQAGDLVLAFAADNKTLAVAGHTVRLWNTDSGAALGELPIAKGDPVVTMTFSPDAKTLALGHYSARIELWNVKDKKSTGAFQYTGSLFAMAWSPDSKKLAAGGGAKIFLWDPQTTDLIRSFDVKEGPPPPTPLVASLAFGPDSDTLAAGGWDALIRIYDLNAKNPTALKSHRVCEGHLSAVFSVAFSRDGRSLVSGSFDKTARLWETFSGKQIAAFKGHVGEVRGVAFADDGRSVYSASADCSVLHWDVPGLSGDGKLPQLTLGPQDIDNAWMTLATEETPRGHEAMWRCTASAKQAIPLLAKKIYLLDPTRVDKLFKDLDSGHYPTRSAAMTELANYGRWMEGRFDAAMADPPSLEYKRRVETLKLKLHGTNSPSLVQERLRVRRIMTICEQARNPEAIATLRQLAARGPEDEIRNEAKASLARLGK